VGGFLIAVRWSKEESIRLDCKGVCRGFHYLDSWAALYTPIALGHSVSFVKQL
jgi:hypothetical protein